MRTPSVLFALFLLILAVVPAQAKLTFVREGQQGYAKEGKERLLLLDGAQWMPGNSLQREIALEHGLRLTYAQKQTYNGVVEFYQGQTARGSIDLQAVIQAWLADELRWKSHAEVNQLRYMDKSGGGIGGWLLDITPAGDGALAIFNWTFLGPSLQPLSQQFLVSLLPSPTPHLEMVRRLKSWPNGLEGGRFSSDYPKLLSCKKHPVLLLASDDLQLLSNAGKTTGTLGGVPGGLPLAGLLADRWFVFSKSVNRHTTLQLYDTQTKKITAMHESWLQGATNWRYYFPPRGQRFLMVQDDYQEGKPPAVIHTVTAPSGASTSIPDPNNTRNICLWHDYVFEYVATDATHHTITVYSTRPGKKGGLVEQVADL